MKERIDSAIARLDDLYGAKFKSLEEMPTILTEW
jgi:hypothetical protein